MFGSVRDGEAANFDVTGEGCFLLKSEEPTAGEVPGDEAVDRLEGAPVARVGATSCS